METVKPRFRGREKPSSQRKWEADARPSEGAVDDFWSGEADARPRDGAVKRLLDQETERWTIFC
ncbi:type I-B CRISPR-associated protein Cas7/Cst2/DevR [Sesbania bispinosa]|nr:type I-B CRISPR-associated protein Cas7/Cst2/DevR [Sesbania bispinosa]